jgi:uncharacterized membrane protein
MNDVTYGLVYRIVSLLIEAFVVWALVPSTGLPYNPTYWQSFVLAAIVTSLVSAAKPPSERK